MRRIAGAAVLLAVALAGCDYPILKKQVAAQEREIADLRGLNGTLTQQLTHARADVLRLEAALERRAPGAASPRPPALEARRRALAKALSGSGASVSLRGDRIVVTTPSAFESGRATLTSAGRARLRAIASALKRQCRGWQVGVAGHTDSARIANPATRRSFATNWHLSGFRALAAMDYLDRTCGIPTTTLHYRGYGQHHPAASNATAAGRARNRRIEIILAPPGTER